MWLVVGLGNPGDEYGATRHNAGFMLVDRLARAWGVELRGRLFKARTALARRGGEEVLLAQPKTFMNRSGLAVREAMAGKEVPPERLVVVYDDLDIPLGEIRVRKQGRPGTHKGMISIAGEIRTDDVRPGPDRHRAAPGRPGRGRLRPRALPQGRARAPRGGAGPGRGGRGPRPRRPDRAGHDAVQQTRRRRLS
ncbi:MAG: aminoacyl-tRNA hydrolase [Anaerotruncus sp.]|nr:aminoacyl-tRNA hydrolase [Anaerotruncus sp.]